MNYKLNTKLVAIFSISTILVIALIFIAYKNTDKINYYYNKLATRVLTGNDIYKRSDISKYEIHGIDISHYQGLIDWKKVNHPDVTKKINFIFIRATMGLKKDKLFSYNWGKSTKHNFTRGAYHYYWSNLNSTIQANNFIKNVELKKGDLPPVLDVEKLPKTQTRKNWKRGIKNWISIIEKHYGIKPIIYTGDTFYKDNLESDDYFKDYPRLWIANYNKVKQPRSKWHFWQYTDKIKIEGIKSYVDANVFKGGHKVFEDLIM
ncbi:MAG: hypothetical protein KAG96_05560 [Ichthyobacteriaceae bacterium]|nr:hypothetical protein [Ichthyobacteriaceae bacterium]